MAYKKYVPPTPKKKTAGEQVKDYFIYMAVMVAVYFVFYYIFMVISWPFRMLFMSERQRFQAKLDKDSAKVQKRMEIRQEYDTYEGNPLFQYLDRFKLHPEVYWQDPFNGQYEDWFNKMKAGEILDTELAWAPEVYRTLKDDEVIINSEFLDYFERQVELHLNEKFGNQVKFMKTVRNLYPEFTPKFSVIPDEIKNYREEVKAVDLQSELIKVMGKKGVSKRVAEELVKRARDTSDLKQAIATFKKCSEKDYSEAMGLYCAKYGYDPDDENADCINIILKEIGNENIASAVIRGDIEVDEVTELISNALEVSESKDEVYAVVNESFKTLMMSKCHAELSGR